MKKKNSIIYIAFLLLALFTSCEEKGKTEPKLDEGDYFPLHVDDFWVYTDGERTDIEKKETLDGKEYYKAVSIGNTFEAERVTYYRKTSDGKVYVRDGEKHEIQMFDFGAKIGEQWPYQPLVSSIKKEVILLSKTEKVVQGDNTFEACYMFSIGLEGSNGGTETIWLAPGIGIVQRAYALPEGGGDFPHLAKLRIDGVEKEF